MYSKIKLPSIISICALTLGLNTASAQLTFSDNFNSYTPATSLGSQADWFANSTAIEVTAGNGLSSSNSISTPNSNNRAGIYENASGSLNDGAITSSIYFNTNADDSGVIDLGLFQSADSGGANSLTAIRLSFNSGNDSFSNLIDGAGSGFGSLGASAVIGDWYYFEVVYTQNGADIDAVATVFESDSDGIVGAQFGSSYNTTLSGSSVASATAFGGIRPRFNGATDNIGFTQIPEPAISAALLVSAVALLLARKKVRQAKA